MESANAHRVELAFAMVSFHARRILRISQERFPPLKKASNVFLGKEVAR